MTAKIIEVEKYGRYDTVESVKWQGCQGGHDLREWVRFQATETREDREGFDRDLSVTVRLWKCNDCGMIVDGAEIDNLIWKFERDANEDAK